MDPSNVDDYSAEEKDSRNPEEVSCNLANVHSNLSQGLLSDNDVNLQCYLDAYKELYNFFVLLGGAFSFVASDIKTKINILQELRTNKKSCEFETISNMIDYEINNNLLSDKKYVSGSRTLLRLHRGLDFLRQFLGEVYKIDETEGTAKVCREVYDRTLGNFHPWTIRKAAQLAMKFLPTKKELLRRTTNDDPAVAKKLYETMPEMFAVMSDVYKRVDDLYTKNKLHQLS